MRRHKSAHLPDLLAEAFKAHREARAGEIKAEVSRMVNRVKKLLAACDDYLTDPDNPEKFYIGPRAEDVTVTYLEPGLDGEKPQRRKAPLTSLIARIEHATGIDVVAWESRHSDPRDVLVKAATAGRGLFELLAKVEGKLNEQPIVNVIVSPEWAALRAELMRALAPFPDARAAVAMSLSRVEGDAGNRIHSV
ncbi:MAG TPA: hypothetical protein VFQ92_08835 [Blastocatellia bacterium]|nr:hypothetical protein [Blastocatellia bacterium]